MKFFKIVVAFTLAILVPMTSAAQAKANTQEQDDYTVLVYMVGSDLESGGSPDTPEEYAGYASMDLEEMMRIGSNDKVNVVVETGGALQWINKNISSKTNQRWLVQKDNLQLIEDVGSRNMGKAATLTDFITWSVEKYPAKKYAIVFWDHGGGSVTGFGSDENYKHDGLTLDEMQKAFADAYTKTKSKFELVGFDACLMGNLEMAKILEPYANYLAASEELEPGHGWDYTPVVEELTNNPNMTGYSLGKVIANGYRDQSIREGTADTITFSVLDLSKINKVVTELESLVKKMDKDIKKIENLISIAIARYNSEDYGSFGPSGGTDMTDLADFANNLGDNYWRESAKISKAVNKAVVYNINSPAKPKATGISIYFPSKDRDNFKSNVKTYQKMAFSSNYQTFLSTYVSKVTSDKKAVSLKNSKPQLLPVKGNGKHQYEVKISTKDAGSLVEVFGILGRLAPDSDSKVHILGVDKDGVELNRKTGSIKGQWSDSWAMLGGQFVTMSIAGKTDKHTEYAIPALVNGEKMNLMVLVNDKTKEGQVLGGWRGIDEETGVVDRNLIPIKPEDNIVPLIQYYDSKTGKTGFDEGAEFRAGEELKVEFKTLPQDNYLYGFSMIDYAQNQTYSDFVQIETK
ncbi:clostripain-related cysteine peptidase [Brevibacillus sp. SYSU BS000544]|uniref:clostripain-related cysteine peptidase n=1 Tax=Brevibacillus sp. SYSU BS000544 TaxID=3416443 RepID=UPI003CE4801A